MDDEQHQLVHQYTNSIFCIFCFLKDAGVMWSGIADLSHSWKGGYAGVTCQNRQTCHAPVLYVVIRAFLATENSYNMAMSALAGLSRSI